MFDKKSWMKEYHRKWYQDNKERLKEKMKDNHSKNLKRDRDRSAKWYSENRDRILEEMAIINGRPETKLETRNRHLKANYGISLDVYNSMLIQQKGKCYICGVHESKVKKALHVDHCHKTKKVRKLLCHKCNFAIGLLKDNIKLVKGVLNYLETYEAD